MNRIVVVLALAGLVACSGSNGSQGPQGPSGPTGPQGAEGIQGPSGPSGPQGEQGLQGPSGPIGLQGPSGPQGPQGVQGFAGDPGPAGLTWRGTWAATDSYAAHDAVAWNGSSYVALAPSTAIEPPSATEWQLLASVGAEGPTGPTGAQGIQGAEGPIGPTGPEGPTGATGPTGPQGPIGLEGPMGPTGPAGTPGAAGADGVSVTSVALSEGDANCPQGGSQFTSASGDTYACNGKPAPGATYRYAVFGLLDYASTYLMNNDPAMFGGVAPQGWKNAARAYQMSADKEVLRTLFTRKGWGGKNAVVHAETRLQYGSADGRMVAALFRIKNATGSAIVWQPLVSYTAFSGMGEYASAALNGVDVFGSGGGSGVFQTTLNLTIPANRTSTLIVVAGGSYPYGTAAGSAVYHRAVVLAFRNNGLALPAGLSFVDDLDTATGGWEQ